MLNGNNILTPIDKNSNNLPLFDAAGDDLPEHATPEERAVWTVLKDRVGFKNRITGEELRAEVYFLLGREIDERSVREIAANMPDRFGKSVVSSCSPKSHGYWVGVNGEPETERAKQQLKSHAISLFRRIRAIDTALATDLLQELQPALFSGMSSEEVDNRRGFSFSPAARSSTSNNCQRCRELRQAGSDWRCERHSL